MRKTKDVDPAPVQSLVMLLDPIVWAAHFQCRLPDDGEQLSVSVPVSRADWQRYWKHTRAEARGYWHGATGRIAERLGFLSEDDCRDEWSRMVRLHQPDTATCLGDSSHDYSHWIERAAVFAA